MFFFNHKNYPKTKNWQMPLSYFGQLSFTDELFKFALLLFTTCSTMLDTRSLR